MALRPIITLPDPKLRLVSAPLERVDDALRKLMDDMVGDDARRARHRPRRDSARRADPAASSSTLAKKDEPPQPLYFVNPEIVWSSDETSVYEEGCLSIPEYYEEVERPASVRVRYRRSRRRGARKCSPKACWRPCCSTRSTISTACCSSTIISKLKRDRVIKKFIKIAKHAADAPARI